MYHHCQFLQESFSRKEQLLTEFYGSDGVVKKLENWPAVAISNESTSLLHATPMVLLLILCFSILRLYLWAQWYLLFAFLISFFVRSPYSFDKLELSYYDDTKQ